WYNFDPFTHITKEQATVGALRKAAEGHDVSIQALSKHEHGGGSDWQAQMKQATANVSGGSND
ncbi:amidohydrolase, partial [Mycobacterium sp. CPCC 205710]|nr:amidohydrolase [Mycobacterium deserti]